ncbi:MAG: HAD hydrolase-like protein [Acidobacteria bacterium]|nr:HAD hydrolase-like protein [Acidobacteriota bacterium]
MTINVAFFDLGETLLTRRRESVPGAREVLAELRRRQVRLGIISNTGDMSRRAILETLPRDFDLGAFEQRLVIFSSEVGVEKPDPRIFRLSVERASLPAEECLFCTENLLHTLAAQQVGMRAARVLPPPGSDVGTLVRELAASGMLG